MPILDSIKPRQEVACDLCGTHFIRGLAKEFASFGDGWEDASVTMWFGIVNKETGKKDGRVKVEFACQECQKEIYRRVSEVVEDMKSKTNAPSN